MLINKIIKIVGEVLVTEVNKNTSQKNCDKWDSLRHLDIIVALEDAFDVTFEPEEIAEMKSLVIIDQMINAHLQSN